MKVLKTLVLTGFAVLLAIFFALFLADNALNNTVLSSSYFDKTFDSHITSQNVEAMINGLTGSTDTFKSLDTASANWLKSTVPSLLKGGFAYFLSGSDSLPTVNIKPLKDSMVKSYADQFIAQNNGGYDQFMSAIKQVEESSGGIMKNGKLNSKAEDQFIQMEQMASINLKKATADNILKKAGGRKADGSEDKAVYSYAVQQMLADQMGLDQAKDTLNLNQLVSNIYGNDKNPVTGVRDLLGGISKNIFLLLLAIVVLLAAIIAVMSFSAKGILRWIGVPMIVVGVLCLIPPALVVVFSGSISLQVSQMLGAGTSSNLSFLQSWMMSYIGGVAWFLFIQSVVVIAIGIAFVIASKVFAKKQDDKHRGPSYIALRVAVALVLIAAIPFSAYFIGKDIYKHTETYDTILKTTQAKKGMTVDKALEKALGVDLFGGLGN